MVFIWNNCFYEYFYLTTNVTLKQKLVNWFAEYIKWPITMWGEHWLLIAQKLSPIFKKENSKEEKALFYFDVKVVKFSVRIFKYICYNKETRGYDIFVILG